VKYTKRLVCAVCLAAFLAMTMACGGFTQGVKDGMSLTQIGQLYRKFLTDKKKAPASAADLLSVATTQEEKDAVQAINDGKLTIIWNIDLNDNKQFPDGAQNTVLGYANATFSDARMVLFANLEMKGIPDAEFKTKPQAGKTATKK
jgi:hypothetical protein